MLFRSPDFATNPFNGAPPTFEQALRVTGRDAAPQGISSANLHLPYSWQTSIGVQRQIGQTVAFNADYVYTGTRSDSNSRNANLSYNPATGANYPYSDVSKRPYPTWGRITTLYSEGSSAYHGLQTAFTKRLNHNWQASATYTLSGFYSTDGAAQGPCWAAGVFSPCPAGFKVTPDVGGDSSFASADQRHRAVFSGIWQLPYSFQLSGLYFFSSGVRRSTSYGADLRDRGSSSGRLRPDGSIIPRNPFVGLPLHRVDFRLLKKFAIAGNVKVDGIFEMFNVFNHANYGTYTTSESSAAYGKPQTDPNVAYQPRMLQLGFRVAL